MNLRHLIAVIQIEFERYTGTLTVLRKIKIEFSDDIIHLIDRHLCKFDQNLLAVAWTFYRDIASGNVFILFSITIDRKIDKTAFFCFFMRGNAHSDTMYKFTDSLKRF